MEGVLNQAIQPLSEKLPTQWFHYHRIDMICLRNKRHKLQREIIAGRSAYYCPICQNSAMLFTRLYTGTSSLWGRLYEYQKGEGLIKYAIEEAEMALKSGEREEIEEIPRWKMLLRALNNYLMALALKGDVGYRNEAYKRLSDFERILSEHQEEIDFGEKQSRMETMCFLRWRLPQPDSGDPQKAREDFNKLEGHPDFQEWKERWESLKEPNLSEEPNRHKYRSS